MNDKDLCPKCGTPVVQSIKGSLDTFVAGYIICWKCRTRIDLENRHPERPGQPGDKPEEASGE
ncbi:MAG: hypothetical protein ACOX8W_08505 [bacterium]|jgi:hypothetical protein